jgi:hypothetical protein
MAIRGLVPWNSRGREVGGRRDEEPHPVMDRWNGTTSWPRIEISKSEKEVQVNATKRVPSWTAR